jgi:hypothetical protein
MAANYYEGRSYWGVVLELPESECQTGMIAQRVGAEAVSEPTVSGAGRFALSRVGVPHSKNLYGRAAAIPSEADGGGFLHDYYVATGITSKREGMGCALVCSPYVRLLHATLDSFMQDDQSVVGYRVPVMRELYDHFLNESYDVRFEPVGAALKMKVASLADRISISGNRPLHFIRENTFPSYADFSLTLRSRFASPKRGTNVRLDANGNVRWYMTYEESLLNVLNVLNLLESAGLTRIATDDPTTKAWDDSVWEY